MTDQDLINDITKKTFRVIVTGSRHFCNYQAVCLVLDKVLASKKDTHAITVISGDCQGPDTLGRAYAIERGHRIEVMEYDPSLGRNASTMRHQRMVEAADGIIALWDGKSEGTRKLLNLMHAAGKPVRVVEVDCLNQCANRWVVYQPEEENA
jgi:hypothetical protein